MDVDIDTKILSVALGSSSVSVSSLVDAVKSVGFDAIVVDAGSCVSESASLPLSPARLRVDGMMCMMKSGRFEFSNKSLTKIPSRSISSLVLSQIIGPPR